MPGGALIRILRRRGAVGRAACALALAALALNAFVVAPHVHRMSAGAVAGMTAPAEPDGAPAAPKHDCPIWMAHGTAGAALPAPFVVVPPPPFACGAPVRLVAAEVSGSRGPAPFAARAPPESFV